MGVESVELKPIPEGEGRVAPTGEEAATAWAVERSEWVVSNDLPCTALYEAQAEGFDYQIEFFCREVVRRRTVFVNETAGGFVAAAWCDSPPGGWPPGARVENRTAHPGREQPEAKSGE